MDQLIPVINKLQDVFSAIGQESIDLPQITVVGSQSAGKSSVLETIVGRDFLPRGSGIVTRRPLVLQLHTIGVEDLSKEEVAIGVEWGEFLHLPNQRFYNFNEIRDEIVRETDRITGRNKAISNKSINLRIFSPHVLNLTLVDLPGITKVPTGDQPDDIEDQIRAMCYEFISNPNAIILAVTAANQDLANSDGLKMARSVDPEGERTIGVLTKVDIMDKGTDCCDILSNQVIPLKKGYIAVMNRSQHDIQTNKSIRQGLEDENIFFQNHPKYRQYLNRCGTRNLARTLSQILMLHIRDTLPEIKSHISRMLQSVSANLDSLGECLDDQHMTIKGSTLLRILSTFAQNFNTRVDGKGTGELLTEMTELYGGARISYIFNEIFGKKLRSLDPFEGLDDDDIRTAIANANGTRPSLFVPEISFDLLVRRQIARLEQPGVQCLDMIVQEMQRMIVQSEVLELQRFPELRDKILEVVYGLLKKCIGPAQKMIANLIQIELAYINTSHPDFVGGKAAAAAAQNAQQQRLQQQAAAALKQPQLSNVDVSGGGNGAYQTQGPLPAAAAASGPNNGSGNGFASPPASQPPAPQSVLASPNVADNKGFLGMFPRAQPSNAASTPAGAHAAAAQPSAGQGSSARPGGKPANSSYDEARGIKLPPVPDKMRCGANPTDREKMETEIIKTLIRSYFDIVKKNFTDLVPKTIMRFLVLTFKDDLQNHLVAELYKDQVMNEFMRETEEVAAKRKAFREMRNLLHRANEIVNEVREFQPSA